VIILKGDLLNLSQRYLMLKIRGYCYFFQMNQSSIVHMQRKIGSFNVFLSSWSI